MDELVKLVSQKVGLPEAQAKQAVEVVLGFIKQKLPAPLAGQVDAVLAQSGTAATAGKMLDGLGGLMGKKNK